MVRLVKDPAEKLLSSDLSLTAYTPEELMARLTENPEERLTVYARDALGAFEAFEERYSGRAINRGVRYIKDEAAAERYAEIQERVIPVIRDLSDWTKVEYMGYMHCALLADPDLYSNEQLDAFFKTMNPEAAILPAGPPDPEFERVVRQADFVYAYEAEDPVERVGQIFSLRFDGLILRPSVEGTPATPRFGGF
jgi:hypothetical protein